MLEPLLSRNMERRQEVVVVHVIRHRRKNLQVTEPAEESPECNVEFAVCEPVDMSMRHLREDKGGQRVAKSTHGMSTHFVPPRLNGII